MKKLVLTALSTLILSISYGQWEEMAGTPPGTERHHPVNFVLDGKAYQLTGYHTTNGLLRDFYVYDPSADQWTQKPNFPGGARAFAYGVQEDGKGYVGFGIDATKPTEHYEFWDEEFPRTVDDPEIIEKTREKWGDKLKWAKRNF